MASYPKGTNNTNQTIAPPAPVPTLRRRRSYEDVMKEINALQSQYDSTSMYNSDPNANLREAMLQANENMGKVDQNVYGRQKANLFAGFDTGFAGAMDSMNANLAKRGLANSGVAVKANKDMAAEKAMKYASINNQAYNQGVQAGDSYRQQRVANLTGYSQLGRGMSGQAQNYLSQAGGTYGNIGSQAGSTAIGLGGLNNSYNSAKWNAQAQADSGKGSATGAAIGTVGSFAFSDSRLKKNVKAICKINGFQICSWDWNEEGIRVAGHAPTYGVIAQEAAKIDPSCVRENKETGYLVVDYNKIFNGRA